MHTKNRNAAVTFEPAVTAYEKQDYRRRYRNRHIVLHRADDRHRITRFDDRDGA